MKKKILIIMPSMHIGGAERSLLGLLESFDWEKYQVDLFLFRQEGDLIPLIPKQVNILNEMKEFRTFDTPIASILKSSLFPYAVARILSKIILFFYCKIFNKKNDVWKSMQYTAKYINPLLPDIKGEYDLALSFLGVPFYMDKVAAKIKMAWIHTDYASLLPNEKLDRQAFSRVDYIVTVSEECEKAFLEKYPDLKEKSMVIENILQKQLIEIQAEEEVSDWADNEDKSIKFLSIGRFCEAKNFDNIPEICSRILKQGLNVKWYLIGYGDEKLIKENIIKYHMENKVIILGKKINPYPYLKLCDWYIQPSRYEGKCVSVREAQLLGKPVIITDYATAKSQIEDGKDGIIVPLDNDKCADAICNVIVNKNLKIQLKQSIKCRNYTNENEIKKIYHLMEEIE